MPEDPTDKPFTWLVHLLIADHNGEYERAARAQRRLEELGWYVSRKPPAPPKKSRSDPRRSSAAGRPLVTNAPRCDDLTKKPRDPGRSEAVIEPLVSKGPTK
jgi:hypothetical protein